MISQNGIGVVAKRHVLKFNIFYQYLRMVSLNIESWSPNDVAQCIKGEEVQNFVAKYMFHFIKTNHI